jgi:hypothetical protein
MAGSSRALALAAAVALGASACESAPPKKPASPFGQSDPGEMDLAILRGSSKDYDSYVSALLLCNSPQPRDWLEATRTFDRLPSFRVFAEDPQLIREFRAGSETARRELGRRGVILTAQVVFFKPYDAVKWDEARRTLLEAGEGGPEILVRTLFSILLNGQYSHLWMHVRYNLVQAGAPALETAVGLSSQMADKAPATPIFALDDLTQLIVLLIEFADTGRPQVDKLAKHPNHNVRRSVARAIGDAVDAAGASTLVSLLTSDPDWQVRAASAQALGRLAARRSVAGPVLVDRMVKEQDRAVARAILDAIGQLHYAEAVPDLVRAMDTPSLERQEWVMSALYHITGEKFITRKDWLEWYRETYPRWKERQPR